MKRDWTGNYNSIFKTLGASSHTDEEREVNDYYATDPVAWFVWEKGFSGTTEIKWI